MNDNKKIYFYITSILAFFIPIPGRFVFAFYALILFNLQILLLTLIFHGVDKLKIGGLKEPVLIFSIIFLTILYKQFLYIVCPVVAITLGFCIYLPSISTFTIMFFFGKRVNSLTKHLINNMGTCAYNSLTCLVLFLLRDALGYGTLTLPGWKRIIYVHLPFLSGTSHAGAFLATIPGALVLFSVLLAGYIFVKQRFDIIARKGAEQ
ncbi:MAG: hypothetical protein II921_04045 [Treponema sp.]|nr:hypothetical protein [Treponema sp.]